MKKEYFAYTRVSTKKQGKYGVSLREQKEDIERYAMQKALPICKWFEGRETASKVGRPVFNEMLALLKKGEAAGVIVHKVDRSARNLHDWAEIGQLMEAGIDIHFATESIDLSTPGGRLSADMQAVMAAFYSRNLREEVKKGFYGRLKQGLFPKPAPVGYLNQGKGKPKIIDPKKGPLVRRAFELYTTGEYSIRNLSKKMYDLGLRSRKGNRIGRNSMGELLANRFYISEIHIKKTGQRFAGVHKPLIARSLFERVRQIMAGRYARKIKVHIFDFRRLLTCSLCGSTMVGETHKGHIYYRCHTAGCLTKTVRQEKVEKPLHKKFSRLQFGKNEKELFAEELQKMRLEWSQSRHDLECILKADLEKTISQSDRLLTAYLDSSIDQQTFDQKKTALELKRREIEQRLSDIDQETATKLNSLQQFLELAGNAYLLHKNASPEKKRELVENLTSNRTVNQKSVDFKLCPAALELAGRPSGLDGGPTKATARKASKLLRRLMHLLNPPVPADLLTS